VGHYLTEQRLAQQLGVSRTPIREVLSTLEEQGILERKRYHGIKLRHPSLKDMVEIYDLRIALEGMAAYLLAPRADQKTLQKLEVLAKECDRLSESRPVSDPENQRIDIEFHQKLINECGNRRLQRLLETFHLLSNSFCLSYKVNRCVPIKRLRFTHQDIVAALKTRDPEKAEKAVRQHIQEGKEHLLAELLESTLSGQPKR